MEFYKEGKVLSLTANTRTDLSNAAYNHKGIIVQGAGTETVKIEFYDKGRVSQGVTLSVSSISSNTFTNALIPVRVAGVTPSASTVTVTLFN